MQGCTKKLHTCQVCGKSFTEHSKLCIHEKTHFEIKLYSTEANERAY